MRADKTSIRSEPKRSISARAMDAEATAEEGNAKAAEEEEVNDAKETAVVVDDAAAVDKEEAAAADSSPVRDNGAATDSERPPFSSRVPSVFLCFSRFHSWVCFRCTHEASLFVQQRPFTFFFHATSSVPL
jgi:hypothetical protein